MRFSLFFFLAAVAFLSTTANASDDLVKISRPLNNGSRSIADKKNWPETRWLIEEPVTATKTLFLVVDAFPADPNDSALVGSLPQQVVHREVVNTADVTKLAQLKETYFDQENGIAQVTSRPQVGRPLWVPVKNSWSTADEDAYSTWFASQVDENFLGGSYTIADCADMAMTFRWVYARNNKLPMADSLSAGGQLFGHFSSNSAWDKLPEDADWKKDQRFQAGLAYLLQNTYTHSLWADLFPVSVDQKHVRPGTVYLFLRPGDGHTQTIKSIGSDPECGIGECVVTYWGNEPASEEIDVSSLIEPDVYGGIGNSHSGFLMWRWPRINSNQAWELTPATAMDGYSTIQYNPPIAPTTDPQTHSEEYWVWLNDQLGMAEQNKLNVYSRDLEAFWAALENRLMTTAKAQVYCVFQVCPPGSSDNDSYSTGDTDAHLLSLSKQIVAASKEVDPNDPGLPQLMEWVNGITLLLDQPDTHSFLNLAMNTNNVLATLNSSATVSFAERWGLKSSIGQINLETPLMASLIDATYRYRDNLVYQADEACAPDGTTISCDPKSPAIQALNTSLLDQALKSQLTHFLTLANDPSLSADEKTNVDNFLQNDELSTDENDTNYATVYDDVLGDGQARVANWSSLPTDTLSKRWGY